MGSGFRLCEQAPTLTMPGFLLIDVQAGYLGRRSERSGYS
jgi:acetyl-CoA carboxylase alpha subunit